MIESAAGTGEVSSPEENLAPPWLIALLKDLKAKRASGERPRDKAHGRWVGDFLDQAPPSGLLPTELKLLQACAQGWGCVLPVSEALSALLAGQTTEDSQQAVVLKIAVEPNRVRAAFLRFLALGGDEFAPVHESGVELHYAFVDSKIDLRGAKCVGRLALSNCFVDGALLVEDATLGILISSRKPCCERD
jgi:hypothetical protein